MYHHIHPPDADSSLVISPGDFERQIEWLERSHFRFLSLDEAIDLEAKIPIFERAVSLTFDDGFRDNYEKAFPLLIEKKQPAALFVVVNWVGKKDFLTWKEIREISERGMTIGSHSLSHRWLPQVLSDDELTQEVSESKRRIEQEIGTAVHHFCYPVGGVDERVCNAVLKAGYRSAWVAGARPCFSGGGLLALRRTKISPSDGYLLRFAAKSFGLKGLFVK